MVFRDYLGPTVNAPIDLPKPPPEKWKSIAVWPDTIRVGYIVGKNESEDIHSSKESAEAVCWLLKKHGYGGYGKVFPISTRVEQVVPQ